MAIANSCDALDRAEFGAVVISPDGSVFYANPPFAEALARSVGDITDAPFQEVVPPILAAEVSASVLLARQSGTARCKWLADTELVMAKTDEFGKGSLLCRVSRQVIDDLAVSDTEELRGPLRDVFR